MLPEWLQIIVTSMGITLPSGMTWAQTVQRLRQAEEKVWLIRSALIVKGSLGTLSREEVALFDKLRKNLARAENQVRSDMVNVGAFRAHQVPAATAIPALPSVSVASFGVASTATAGFGAIAVPLPKAARFMSQPQRGTVGALGAAGQLVAVVILGLASAGAIAVVVWQAAAAIQSVAQVLIAYEQASTFQAAIAEGWTPSQLAGLRLLPFDGTSGSNAWKWVLLGGVGVAAASLLMPAGRAAINSWASRL